MAQQFMVMMSLGLSRFPRIQTGRHRGYFILDEDERRQPIRSRRRARSLAHAVLLIAYMLLVVFLAEQLAHPIDYLIETLQGAGAARRRDHRHAGGDAGSHRRYTRRAGEQPAALDQYFLGSVLSTIGLTVPIMLVISYLTAQEVYLGLVSANNLLLAIRSSVNVVNLASGRTNSLHGAVHVMLFATIIMVIQAEEN